MFKIEVVSPEVVSSVAQSYQRLNTHFGTTCWRWKRWKFKFTKIQNFFFNLSRDQFPTLSRLPAKITLRVPYHKLSNIFPFFPILFGATKTFLFRNFNWTLNANFSYFCYYEKLEIRDEVVRARHSTHGFPSITFLKMFFSAKERHVLQKLFHKLLY